MDFVLLLIIGAATCYAGGAVAVASLPSAPVLRAVRRGAFTAAAVAGSFALMLALSWAWLPGAVAVVVLFAVAATYLTVYADLRRDHAWLIANAAGLIIGVSFVFVSYLAVLALIGATGLYLVLRRWVQKRWVMAIMGGALAGLLAASAGVFLVALSTM